MGWCVERFSTFARPDLAARLAMAADALSGGRSRYDMVADSRSIGRPPLKRP